MTKSIFNNKLAIVIATKDRPRELEGLLSNLSIQSFYPQQTIIVDGGDAPVKSLVESYTDLNVEYIQVHPPALTRQKNAGVAQVRSDISLIGFIDDDITLEDGSLETMMKFWDDAPEQVGGASFNLTDYYDSMTWLKSLPQRLFFIDNRGFGKVLGSGFNTPIWTISDTRFSRWLGGGYTIWRRSVFESWKFDEWYPASGLFEDVHFSYQVGKRYQLAVVAEAMATHQNNQMRPKEQFLLGKRQVANWVYFVKSNPELSLAMCLWGCVGRTATNFAKGMGRLDRHFVLRALGNSMGLAKVLTQFLNPSRGQAGN